MYQKFSDKIIKCFVEMIIFLEFSDENIVNSDSAIEILELISSELQSMDESNKEFFKKQIEKIAISYSADKKKFVLSLPEYLGL